MTGHLPFALLYSRLMEEGIGRVEWLKSRNQNTRGEKLKPWRPKEIADACGVDQRTEQTWRSGKAEPKSLQLLEALFFGKRLLMAALR
jgi:hypothetical protein